MQIEDLQCTALSFSSVPSWPAHAEPEAVVRHSTEPDARSLDIQVVTYTVTLEQGALILASLTVSYRLTFLAAPPSDARGVAALKATWPYLRVRMGDALAPLGLPNPLPVQYPLHDPPPQPEEALTAATTSDVSRTTVLPQHLETSLALAQAMQAIASGERRWVFSAFRLYGALYLASRSRDHRNVHRLHQADDALLDQLLRAEGRVTLAQVRALPSHERRRLREQARELLVVVVHQTVECRAETTTGVRRDAYLQSVETLLDPPDSGDVRWDIPQSVREALMTLQDPIIKQVTPYKHHSVNGESYSDKLGFSFFLYGTGYNFATEDRMENVGHTRHFLGLHHFELRDAEVGTASGFSLYLDVSEELERWAGIYTVASLPGEEQARHQRVLQIEQGPSPLPLRALSDLGSWAAGLTNVREVEAALRVRHDLSAEALEEAASLDGIDVGVVVRHPNCPESLRSSLVNHPEREVRMEVAESSRIPATLHALYDDHDEVRRALANNPTLPPSLQELLAHSRDDLVRMNLAWNPSVAPRLLAYLGDDPWMAVRYNLAHNPSLPEDTLKALLTDPDEEVRACARTALTGRGGFSDGASET